MKTQSFNNRIFTAAPLTMGALMMAAAIAMTGALRPHSAHAASTSTAAEAPQGFRAKMRERIQERVQERMKEEADKNTVDKKLTADQVRDIVAGHIAMSGNPNIKVGKVTAKEEGVVAVDVVTKTGALVATREISTKTGHPVNMDEMMGAMMDGPGGPRGQMMRRHMEGRMGGPLGEHMHDRMAHMDGGEKHEHRDLALTADQAKKLAEARLIMLGNKNLKVGAVKEKDADSITVEIVAASDNSLVVQRLIDRHTGRPQRG